MTKYQRTRMKHGLQWKSHRPPYKTILKRALPWLVSVLLSLLVIALLFTRAAQLKAEREAQHISESAVHLLNGGAVMIDDSMLKCSLTPPIKLVSNL